MLMGIKFLWVFFCVCVVVFLSFFFLFHFLASSDLGCPLLDLAWLGWPGEQPGMAGLVVSSNFKADKGEKRDHFQPASQYACVRRPLADAFGGRHGCSANRLADPNKTKPQTNSQKRKGSFICRIDFHSFKDLPPTNLTPGEKKK